MLRLIKNPFAKVNPEDLVPDISKFMNFSQFIFITGLRFSEKLLDLNSYKSFFRQQIQLHWMIRTGDRE